MDGEPVCGPTDAEAAQAAITFVSGAGWHPWSVNGAGSSATIRNMTCSRHHLAGRIPAPPARGCAGYRTDPRLCAGRAAGRGHAMT
jgi:hypothetical protein